MGPDYRSLQHAAPRGRKEPTMKAARVHSSTSDRSYVKKKSSKLGFLGTLAIPHSHGHPRVGTHLQLPDLDALVSEVPRHLLAREHAGRGGAGTDGPGLPV